MKATHILPIRNEIAQAAGDLAHCDTEALRDIALKILRMVAERDVPELTPTPAQRAVLCDVAQSLIGNEAFGRSSWRLQAAEMALRSVERLTSGGVPESA